MSDHQAAVGRRSSHTEKSDPGYDEVSVLDEMTMDGEGYEEEDDEIHEEDGVSDTDTVSLDDLLREKNSRIESLERANRIKDEKLQLLQQKLNDTKTKHKEGIYWLQLELDSARRENDATEEQMAELMNDLQAMTKIENPTEVSQEVLRDSTIRNYEQALASLENQITMIKTSADEVVKSLKEEIADLMEDRATIEVDLLNQLAVLENEKTIREAELEHELKMKTDTIKRLLLVGAGAKTPAEGADLEEYEAEIGRLLDAKKQSDINLTKEREESEDRIQRLELANAKLKADLDRAEEDLAMFQSEHKAEETLEALKLISKERMETVQTLENAAAVWKKTDAAIQALEDTIDRLRPDDDVEVKGDSERLLSTLETACLVHGQVKVSLMLIEMKLRNQLQSLKNDKVRNGGTGLNDEHVSNHMKSIQNEVLKVISQVETTLSAQIRGMEQRALEETKLMKEAIQKRSTTLESMQLEHKALEEEIRRLKASDGQKADKDSADQREQQENKSAGSNSSHSAVLNGIKKSVFEQLNVEVLRIIQRVKEKNEIIQAMKVKLDDHRNTEERLKKELKRVMRKIPTTTKSLEEAKAKDNGDAQSPKKETVAAVSPISPLLRSPNKTQRRASVDVPMLSPKPNPSILPLAPSPREISKSRVPSLMGSVAPMKTNISP